MLRPFSVFSVLASGAAVLALAGCGSSSSSGPTTTNSYSQLTAAQKSQVDSAVVTQVEASVTSLVSFDPTGIGLGFSKTASMRGKGMMQLMGSRVRPAVPTKRFQSDACITETPADPVDTDEDGVPDTLNVTYANCTFGSGQISESLNGSLAVGDPTPDVADIAYQSGINLTLALTDSGETDNLTLTEASQASEAPGLISQSGTASVSVAISGAPSADFNGTAAFSAADTGTYAFSGGTITYLTDPFPAGTFNLSGGWTYNIHSTNLTANLSFHVTTGSAGLAIDPTNCQNTDGSHIVSGTVTITFSDNTVVTAIWANCTPASITAQ